MTMPRRHLHGNRYRAPDEEIDVTESPSPGPVAACDAPRGTAPLRVITGLKVALGVATVLVTSGLIAWGVYRYAVTSPRFALTRVVIEGAIRLTPPEVRKRAKVKLGENLFRLDPEAIGQRLLGEPWIREARVRRNLPDELAIDLVEREAQAIAVVGDQMVLVTPDGVPFKELEPGDPYDLPIVTGVDASEVGRDGSPGRGHLVRALDVLRRYRRIELSRAYPPQEANVSPSGQVTLTVGKAGIALHLGDGPWTKKLLMAARVISRARRQGAVPGIVFLDNRAHPERVVVRMR